jgi:hypothetical protein
VEASCVTCAFGTCASGDDGRGGRCSQCTSATCREFRERRHGSVTARTGRTTARSSAPRASASRTHRLKNLNVLFTFRRAVFIFSSRFLCTLGCGASLRLREDCV